MSELKIKMLPGEAWYGPSSKHGLAMPHTEESVYSVNVETSSTCNQDNPLLISTLGRYVFAPRGFSLDIKNGEISVSSKYGEIDFAEGLGTLRGAFLAAKDKYFTPNGEIPPEEFFTIPQYNTWIELIYDQNQADVMRYAHGIVDNGMPAGIIMIDDGWNDYYGSFRFSKEKFPDPEGMCRELHEMGFKVMMWICPFISADSREFRDLRDRNMLIRRRTENGEIREAVREWWNGWSGVLDMTNPETVAWLEGRLQALCDMGIDGYKLDGGDAVYYTEDDVTYEPVTPMEQAKRWNDFGLKFRYNEYRASFKCVGLPFVQRLHDKAHSWKEGVAEIVPDTIAQSLLGYAYTCPDMIGGGCFGVFLPNSTTFDPELLIRYCEASALMPMMQFSLAPWRVLSDEHYKIVLDMARLHERFAPKIIDLAHKASVTGETIVRSLEYVFPGEGFEKTTDIFMLGDDVLVAPVVEKGAVTRTLRLPRGTWSDEAGNVYEGGREITVDAPLDYLPYFYRK